MKSSPSGAHCRPGRFSVSDHQIAGFAGQRVIKQTIGSDLPEGFQRAEFLLEHGAVDMVVNRNEMKKTISDLLCMFLDKEIQVS